jgi:peptidoglycan lytic transglycosylase D
MRRLALVLIAVILNGTPAWAELPPVLEPSQIPSLISSIRIEEPLAFCDEAVPLEDPDVHERLEKELLLSVWNRAQVILWLKRANRYFPHIEKMLARQGLPDDLKYVAVVESALRPHVSSNKSAVGFWQFLKSTGKRYGLRVDRHIDQRRSIFHATDAAIGYFQFLHGKFNSWTLAAAAYNTGENRLSSEIDLQEVYNFYQLYLPLETQRYILKILSAKLILTSPEKYGFHLEPSDLYPPLEFDRVTLNAKRDIPVTTIAKAAHTHFKRIKDLNPEIRGYNLVKGKHRIIVPKGAGEGFQKRFKQLAAKAPGKKGEVYVVRKGDSLTGIAHKFDVSLGALLIWNGLSPKKPIHPGDKLMISPK